MDRARKGVHLLDFEGLYGDDPFSKPRWRGGKVVDLFKGLSEQGGFRRRKAGSASSSMRAATGSPEAVVKLASWGSGAASARDQLNYISREGELELTAKTAGRATRCILSSRRRLRRIEQPR